MHHKVSIHRRHNRDRSPARLRAILCHHHPQVYQRDHHQVKPVMADRLALCLLAMVDSSSNNNNNHRNSNKHLRQGLDLRRASVRLLPGFQVHRNHLPACLQGSFADVDWSLNNSKSIS